MTVLLAGGWLIAAALGVAVVGLRRRLELVARAEHELRGPAAALGLGLEAARRQGVAISLEAELARLGAGLEDLAAARAGRARVAQPSCFRLDRLVRLSAGSWRPAALARGRELVVDWRAGPVTVRADRGRLAQALGNLLGNAVEHGAGTVRLHGRRAGDGRVLVEVHNGLPAERGRGLGIAAQAARESGGRLALEGDSDRVTASIELPAADA